MCTCKGECLGTKLAYLHILPFSSRLKGVYSTDNHDCAILYNIPAQVLSCVSQLLLCDPTPQVQRAALLVFSLLLKGLSHKTISVLGDSLHDIYHLLKHVEEEREGDELTRTHARAALGELDRVMRDWIFPQQTLSKNITILHL